jgi:hypothetical protein
MKRPAKKKGRGAAQVAGAQTATLADQLLAARDLRFGPEEQALVDETNKGRAHRVTIGQAFDTYQGRLNEIAGAQRKGWQDAMAMNAGLASQVKSTLGVGGTGNATLDAGLQAQQAGGNATEGTAIQNQGALLGSLGLSEANDLSRRSAAADVGRQQRFDEVDSHLRAVQGKKTALKHDEGAFVVDLLRQMQAEDAKNSIAAAGLQVDRDKASMQHSEFLSKLNVDKLLASIKAKDIQHDNALGDAALAETGRHNAAGETVASQNAATGRTNARTQRENADTRRLPAARAAPPG